MPTIYTNKIIFRNNDSYTKMYQGSNLIAEVGSVSYDFFKLTASQANSTVGLSKLSSNQTLQYSTNGTSWTNMNTNTTVTLANIGDYIYLKGTLSSNNSTSNYTQFTMSGGIEASGKIGYLWNSTTPTATVKQYCGYSMFSGCTALTSIDNLTFPSSTATYCYGQMFYSCTSLITAPTNLLPATTLNTYCYNKMFYNCTSLTTAPSLPARTATASCYGSMFQYSGLITAPSLPATTLASDCYSSMFSNCYSLTTAPSLPATTLKSNCYNSMFQYCKALTTAPSLPATTLITNCYKSMFKFCSHLTKVTVYATSWNTTYTDGWLSSVAATGDFYNLGGATIPTGSGHGIPSGWTEHTSL